MDLEAGTRTLFDETRLGAVRLKNRLVRSATWEAMADDAGQPTARLIEVYREIAEGGAGLIITSATVIAKDATAIPGMISIADDRAVPGFRELVRAVHGEGCPVVMQLSFIGSGGERWTPATPATGEIGAIVQAYAEAARRAEQAGFDGVQIHAAHGFFLSQFLNDQKNTRTDRYGGTVDNRVRFLLEIYDAIRERTSSGFLVLVKINCSDFEGDGNVRDACLSACTQLAKRGIDAVEVSGGVSGAPFPPEGLPYDESIFRDYATEIARIVDVPVMLVGLNRTPAVLGHLLRTTHIEYFSLARPLMRQPDLPKIWQNNPDTPSACTSCDACRKQSGGNVCPFRDRAIGTNAAPDPQER